MIYILNHCVQSFMNLPYILEKAISLGRWMADKCLFFIILLQRTELGYMLGEVLGAALGSLLGLTEGDTDGIPLGLILEISKAAKIGQGTVLRLDEPSTTEHCLDT